MKCSSCGKEFNEEKYYRICPKCGTYNNVKRQDISFDQPKTFDQPETFGQQNAYAQTQNGTNAGTYQEYNGAYTPPYTAPPAQKTSGGLKGLVIALIILLVLGVAVFVASMVVVLREVDSGMDTEAVASYLLDEAVQEKKVSFGEAFVLEEDEGLELQLDAVEVVCEADAFADFPQGQKLVGISFTCPGADISYDTYEESPLGMIYVGYDQVYKEVLEGDSFKGYRSVTGERADFDPWGMRYGDPQTGYVYVFLPAEVTEGTVYVETRNPENGELTEIFAADFVLGEVQ